MHQNKVKQNEYIERKSQIHGPNIVKIFKQFRSDRFDVVA